MFLTFAFNVMLQLRCYIKIKNLNVRAVMFWIFTNVNETTFMYSIAT